MAASDVERQSLKPVERDINGLHISEGNSHPAKDPPKSPPRRPGMTYDEDGNELVTLDQLLACTSARGTSREETDEDITHAQLQARFDEALKTWQSSTCRDELLEIVSEHQPDNGDFDKVVCLGSGRFCQRESNDADSRDTASPSSGQKSVLQLACVVDIAREMRKNGQCEVELLAQDPAYTSRDLALLVSQGVKVLKMDTERHGLNVARDHIDPRTILLEFHVCKDPWTLKDMYSGAIGLVIGASVEGGQDLVSTCWKGDARLDRQSALDIMDEFEQTHDSCDFPRFAEHPWVFRNLVVYWPDEQESEQESGIDSEEQGWHVESSEQDSDVDSKG